MTIEEPDSEIRNRMKEFQWLLTQSPVTVYVDEQGRLVWRWEYKQEEKKRVYQNHDSRSCKAAAMPKAQ